MLCVFFQAEDGIRYLVRSRGLGDVYKRQVRVIAATNKNLEHEVQAGNFRADLFYRLRSVNITCLLYTSDAADERSSVDLGGRRYIKKKKQRHNCTAQHSITTYNVPLDISVTSSEHIPDSHNTRHV